MIYTKNLQDIDETVPFSSVCFSWSVNYERVRESFLALLEINKFFIEKVVGEKRYFRIDLEFRLKELENIIYKRKTPENKYFTYNLSKNKTKND
jgi:hypothetical protein